MLTGVILARNEEPNIVACLKALERHVDEIILIDMESGDRTVELARPYIDQLLNHPLIPNFDSARNLAIPKARFDWLWFVDADEWVTDQVGQLVNRLIRERGNTFEAINIPFMSHFCGQWMQHCGWWPGYTCPRVLKRGHFEYSRTLHGGVKQTGREIRFPADAATAIPHHSYTSVEHWVRKCNGYTTTESLQLAERGCRWDWRLACRMMVRDLWQYYERNQGHLDGDRGWILSWLSGQYRWLSAAKLVDQLPPDSRQSAPRDLDEVFCAMQEELALCRQEVSEVAAAPQPGQVRLAFEGEFFAGHSFSNINERIASHFVADRRLAVTLARRRSLKPLDAPADMGALLAPFFNRPLPNGPQVTVRHAYPPNWQRPESGAWVHVQPWEYGSLPADWVAPLRDDVDEIWVPSHYVGRIYRDSGIPAAKIQYIPWGVDLECFSPTAAPRKLATEKSFRLLFVGGTIWRKGIDRVLEAYLAEFTRDDDVALVIKDLGTRSFYPVNFTERIAAAQNDPRAPQIIYLDDELTPKDLAGVYTACQALVMPYRGEGFCLPALEAMACGLPVLVPQGGPTDDFVESDAGVLLKSRLVETRLDAECLPEKPFTVLEIDTPDLRRAMRQLQADRETCVRMGRRARVLAEQFPWSRTAHLMAERVVALAARNTAGSEMNNDLQVQQVVDDQIGACVVVRNDERRLADLLCRLRPYVNELVVTAVDSTDRSTQVALEYGAKVLTLDNVDNEAAYLETARRMDCDWVLCLTGTDGISEQATQKFRERATDVPPDVNEVYVSSESAQSVTLRRRESMIDSTNTLTGAIA
ncbi:MAG: glycosyltransferase [Planctomycetes bacterium]|nr:glycosyltransferase [Planctomycetota bacterium]